jgi:hypothetical protein
VSALANLKKKAVNAKSSEKDKPPKPRKTARLWHWNW